MHARPALDPDGCAVPGAFVGCAKPFGPSSVVAQGMDRAPKGIRQDLWAIPPLLTASFNQLKFTKEHDADPDSDRHAHRWQRGFFQMGQRRDSADLARFGDQITRVQAHFSDENAGKKDTDDSIQCTLEVRLEGRQPMVLKHNGVNLKQAVAGASEKMGRLLDSTLGKSGSI
ncbi:MAG: hypothetical protein IPH15_06825 [Comamonadaceae bacterium]|nr:hypothetical protein [Comamonadaceae bacterium]